MIDPNRIFLIQNCLAGQLDGWTTLYTSDTVNGCEEMHRMSSDLNFSKNIQPMMLT